MDVCRFHFSPIQNLEDFVDIESFGQTNPDFPMEKKSSTTMTREGFSIAHHSFFLVPRPEGTGDT